ncbi:MAG: hypothetical protein II951_05895 [Bacteroidales bacterium]|nr:hypothetical protein [Bacteroidales bacterium]
MNSIKTIAFCSVLVVFIVAMTSCSKSGRDERSVNDVILTEVDLPALTNSAIEKVKIDFDSVYETRTFVYHDTILIQFDEKVTGHHFFNLSVVGSNKCFAQYFKRGQGPRELLAPYVFGIEENRLRFWDMMTSKHGVINIDSAIVHGNSYEPMLTNREFPLTYCNCWPNDTTCVMVNVQYMEGFCADSVKEFLVYDVRNDKFLVNSADNTQCFPCNVTGCSVVYNRERGRMMAAYSNRPIYAFYNSKLELIKRFIGPEPDDAVFRLGNKTEVVFDGLPDIYYMRITCTDRHIIAANYRLRKSKYRGESHLTTCEVFLIDWDGNIVARKNIGQGPVSLSYSEETNTLYWTALDEEEQRCLYKCKLGGE